MTIADAIATPKIGCWVPGCDGPWVMQYHGAKEPGVVVTLSCCEKHAPFTIKALRTEGYDTDEASGIV